jgi:hypothetical protein
MLPLLAAIFDGRQPAVNLVFLALGLGFAAIVGASLGIVFAMALGLPLAVLQDRGHIRPSSASPVVRRGATWGLVAVSIFLALGCAAWEKLGAQVDENVLGFHGAVAGADRIVIRDGGFDCCHPVDKDSILFEVTDPKEIRAVLGHIEFKTWQTYRSCNCCGYPGMDWYCGSERIALTSIQHGVAIRWREFIGDAELTQRSSTWLTQWLVRHGVRASDIEHGCGGPHARMR